MKRIIHSFLILSCSNLVFFTPALANAADDPFALRVIRDTDIELSCQQLADEALLMRDIIQTTETIKNDSDFSGHAVTGAAAIGSFLVGTVTGGLGLAAAGYVASQGVEADGEKADSIQDIARQRRALMIGIHKTKGCQNSITAAITPVESKTPLQTGSERLARMEPASGKEARLPAQEQPPHYND